MTETQEKRRAEFKKQAIKKIKSCTDKKLTMFSNKLKKGEYTEWDKDYHSLISQGKKIRELDENEFRVFVMAVYAWMPVLYSQQDVKLLRKNVIKIIEGDSLDEELISSAMECFTSNKHVNGSISALSKLLHFCDPIKFPIWDTRVAKALGRKSGTGNSIDIYMDYFSVMTEIENKEILSAFYTNYKKIIDKKATNLRAIEHVLFLSN